MTEPIAATPWRNLGQFEVLGSDLEPDGEPWDAVFPPEFAEPVADWLRAELPDTGWRQVTIRERGDRAQTRQLFAAPTDNGWALATVWMQADAPPTFMGDIGRYQPRPDEVTRRRGLRLTWNEPLERAAADLNDLTVMLTNTSAQTWQPDAEEHRFVHAHFLDEQGKTPADCSFAFGRYQGEMKGVTLAPGESIQLPVVFGHNADAAPGSYAIEAIMVSFNLRSPKARLTLT